MTDIEFDAEIIRSDRKTLSVEITGDGNVKVRAPKNIPVSEIEKVLISKRDWITAHIKKQKERKADRTTVKKMTYAEINELADKALSVLPERIRRFARLMNVEYNGITVRNQKTRWGSCSAKGNLNFNCLLMLLPDDIVDYVIVHELSHLKEMNHSQKFWNEVGKVIPDYKEKVKWLKQNGSRYIAMLPE